ncbi:hypothetical protein [Thiomicrorhabdus sediminis]|uniref:Uncharacterized protein n=1 Tax=Thiomicrorhabdus sediminis TaxID=2580412 RepID=A0A4P9K7C5_9GAMM|nr:hypothetical protein [Thiomicrorhabdus sediminis]QCU90985.1 hypothetical protein FE785_10300 [Thiomicrorhabdus sediminis]
MLKINSNTKKLIALILATQLLLAMFFANFHLGMTEHEFGEKSHYHLSLNDHNHHQDTDYFNAIAESFSHEHHHAGEIHIHLNLIASTSSVLTPLIPPSSEVIPLLTSEIGSFSHQPLLPPPNA